MAWPGLRCLVSVCLLIPFLYILCDKHAFTGGWQLAQGHDTPTNPSSSGSTDSSSTDSGVTDEADGEERDMTADMLLHVEAGVTAVDCGDIYTGVEGLVGRFLRDHRPTSMLPEPVQVGGWASRQGRNLGD